MKPAVTDFVTAMQMSQIQINVVPGMAVLGVGEQGRVEGSLDAFNLDMEKEIMTKPICVQSDLVPGETKLIGVSVKGNQQIYGPQKLIDSTIWSLHDLHVPSDWTGEAALISLEHKDGAGPVFAEGKVSIESLDNIYP